MIGFAVLKRVLDMKQDYEIFMADGEESGLRIKEKVRIENKDKGEIKVEGKTEVKNETKVEDKPEINELTDRQIMILSLFNKKDKLFMDEIEKNIKGVHVRTLRREMEKLKEMDLIDKKGSTRNSFYVKK